MHHFGLNLEKEPPYMTHYRSLLIALAILGISHCSYAQLGDNDDSDGSMQQQLAQQCTGPNCPDGTPLKGSTAAGPTSDASDTSTTGDASNQAAASAQQPQLTPEQQQVTQDKAAALNAANAGDFAGALQAIAAAQKLSPNDQELNNLKANVILQIQHVNPDQMQSILNQQAQPFGSARTDELFNPAVSQQGKNLGAIGSMSVPNAQATAAPKSMSALEYRQLRLAAQKVNMGDYTGAEPILVNILHGNSGIWSAHKLLAQTFIKAADVYS